MQVVTTNCEKSAEVIVPKARVHETAVCRTARTVVWEVGKREVGGKHFYQRVPPTRLCKDKNKTKHLLRIAYLRPVFL